MNRLFLVVCVVLGGWFRPSAGFAQAQAPIVGPFELAMLAKTPEKAIWVMQMCNGKIPLRVGARLAKVCQQWTPAAVAKLTAELLAPLAEEDTLAVAEKFDGKASGEQVVLWSRGFAKTPKTLAAWRARLEKAEDFAKLLEAWKNEQ